MKRQAVSPTEGEVTQKRSRECDHVAQWLIDGCPIQTHTVARWFLSGGSTVTPSTSCSIRAEQDIAFDLVDLIVERVRNANYLIQNMARTLAGQGLLNHCKAAAQLLLSCCSTVALQLQLEDRLSRSF